MSNLTELVVIIIAPTAVGIASSFLRADYCREGQGVVCVQDAA
ncbi:MAG: hypothetical protein RQ842_08470 [Vulcanisaeta sp.]|nr:hypothetical protein [Vulcanisaeta sp.]